jgi:hypothetical protein
LPDEDEFTKESMLCWRLPPPSLPEEDDVWSSRSGPGLLPLLLLLLLFISFNNDCCCCDDAGTGVEGLLTPSSLFRLGSGADVSKVALRPLNSKSADS